MRKTSILKVTVGVTILVVICKMLGFVREALIANYYGATASTDAFFFAQGMPATIFPSICNSISTAFTTLYIENKQKNGDISSKQYSSKMIIATGVIGLLLSMLGVTLSSLLVPIFAPGFHEEQLKLAIHFTRLVMGAFFLTMFQYMLSAVLNANKLFYAAQIGYISHNIIVILLTILIGKQENMDLLTLSVIGGLFFSVIVLAFYSRKEILFSKDSFHFHGEIKTLLMLSLPIILGNGVIQINTIVDKALSSTLSDGSLSSLSYAGTIISVVNGVFIASLSTVLYPSFAEKAAKNEYDKMGEIGVRSSGLLSLVLLYVSLVTFVDARQIISIVFERGSFNSAAAQVTANVLACYAFVFPFSGIREILTRALFAIKDTRTPMVNSAIGVVINIICSIIFVKVFGIIGIALGTVVSNIIISGLLVQSVKVKITSFDATILLKSFLKQILAFMISLTIILMIKHLLAIQHPLISLIIDSCIVFITYIGLLYLFKSTELIYAGEHIRPLIAKILKKQED